MAAHQKEKQQRERNFYTKQQADLKDYAKQLIGSNKMLVKELEKTHKDLEAKSKLQWKQEKRDIKARPLEPPHRKEVFAKDISYLYRTKYRRLQNHHVSEVVVS